MQHPNPDFIGIGAQKAGTTWLYFALAHHPQIFMPDCKEVHFWDQYYAKGYAWYEGLFQKEASAQIKRGEITPAYAILPETTVAEIAGRYPHLRLIYMVRNPVARAWSGALMALRRSEMRLEEASDQWFMDHFRSQGSQQRGDYAACLRTWLRFFPKEQMVILDYDAIRTNPKKLLGAVAEHIGVEKDIFDKLPDGLLAGKKNEGQGHPVRPSLVAPLEAMYKAKRYQFGELLEQHGMTVVR